MDSSGRVVLPSAFEDADIDNLALLIADMLERLMGHNDQIPFLPYVPQAVPSINVLDYLRRIIKFTKVEKSCLLLTLHYVDQICARTPLFTLSSLTCHRFIIASIAVCSKGMCDTFCTNSFYARVGGIPVSELNDLEREFLRMIDWRLTFSRNTTSTSFATDSTGRFYIRGMSPSPLIANATPSPGTTIVPSDFSPTLPIEDSDMESMATSRSPSPAVSSPPVLPHLRALPTPSPALPSTILIDTATLTPQAPQGPTIEQNMAFADLQKSWGGIESGPQPDRFGGQIP
ncbi:cyclin-domain-containing protein [Pisolithus microcarpus]|nr:cyclin-domain-containing protein [Pisolithus microcarpus]